MVNLTPWSSRRRDIGEPRFASNLRGQMDRLMDRLFEPFEPFEPQSMVSAWMPALEVCEHGHELVISAELPGVDPEQINVVAAGNQLVISGEKNESKEERDQGIYRSERRYGMFRRVIDLPQDVDPENVKADYSNGVLTLRLPRSEASQPKRIPVSAGGRQQSSSGSERSQKTQGQSRPQMSTAQSKPGQSTNPVDGESSGRMSH